MYTIDYIPTLKQRKFHGSCADEVLFGGAAGGGKLLSILVTIPTINGWVRMGDIKIGDEVFGPDGNPYPVVQVSPIGNYNGYEFTFDDGSRLISNDDHLWLTYAMTDGNLAERTTGEIVRTLFTEKGTPNHAVPEVKACQVDSLLRFGFYPRRYIVKAKRLKEPVPMRCIAIDSPDHLYLAGESFIPTHNSKAIVMDAFFRCIQWPHTHAYIFRRTYGELEDTIIKEAKESYPVGIYKYNGGRHEMALLNGSVIHFRHCSSVADMYNYKGAEIQWLYFDELTTFEYEIYDFIKTRLRAKKKLGIIPCVRSASNPGGLGHGWVKKMFVDAATPMQMFDYTVKSQATGKTRTFKLQYIPSLLTENPYIGDDYLFQLEAKPKALRDALLFGNWDAFEGQVFIEWCDLVNKANKTDEDFINLHQRTWTHVIRPKDIKIQSNWPRYMSFDYGYSRPFSVGWWAIDPMGCAIRYREWYGCEPGRPNTGIQFTPRQIAEGILEREVEETAENISIDRVADPSIFDRSRGDSVAQQMEPLGGRRGVYFRPGDNTRMAGKAQIHERLRFGPTGIPKLQVLSTCKDFIRTIPTLPYSLTKPEDVDTDAEDHIFDETRYLCMARPLPIRDMKPKATVDYDPFRSYRRE